jgi:hypothetical protein
MASEVVYTLAQKGHDMFTSHTWVEMKVLLRLQWVFATAKEKIVHLVSHPDASSRLIEPRRTSHNTNTWPIGVVSF